MNNKLIGWSAAGLVVLAVFGGMLGAYLMRPAQTGGDFAGGIVPTNLWTGNAATNSVTPVTANVLVNGAISIGGTSANNQFPVAYTAVAVYPGQTSLSIPSGASPSSSATTTQVAFSASGFAIGDPCEVQYNFSTSTIITSGNVSAVNGSAVTTTVSLLNTTGAGVTATVTSTVTGASSTIKATCFATGV